MYRSSCFISAALLVVATISAQPAAAPQFEVASIKVSKIGNGVRGGCHGIDSHYTPGEAASAPPLGRCVITDGRLSHIVSIAYQVPQMRWIKTGPDWIARGSDRFNIEAKAEDPTKTTEKQLLEMLQAFVVEQFKMKFHRETVTEQGFALVVGKNGPKLKPAKGEDVQTSFGPGMMKPSPGQPITLTGRKYSMAMLASALSFASQGPVVDRTNLTGDYDLTLSWDETNGPSLVTAVQEQLGLKLEAQKVPVSMFVIDSAQKPSEN